MTHNAEHKFRTLGESFFNALTQYKGRIFQCFDDTNEVSFYSEILKWSIRTAMKLKKKGITRVDIISSCSGNHKYSAIPFIASQFLGAICCNFDPRLSESDTIHLLKLVEPKVIFVDENAVEFIETCIQKANVNTEMVVFGNSQTLSQFSEYLEPEDEEDNFQITEVKNNTDTALIMFSSGTTGLPKGICLNHKAVLRYSNELAPYTEALTNGVILTYSPLYWYSAVVYLLKSMLVGSLLIVRNVFDPVYAWTLIEKYKVTEIFLPPYYAKDFVRYRPNGCNSSSLKSILLTGCAVSKELSTGLRTVLPQASIVVVYAQTETAGTITTFNPLDPKQLNFQLQKPESSGVMRQGMQWKVVDIKNENIVLGPNQKGELRLKSDGYLLNCYYKMDPLHGFDSEGYWKTGDIVYYDEDECFYIVDRINQGFKYKGWHILPSILEHILLSHPAVKDGIIFGVPHESDGAHPIAVVELFKEYRNTSPKEIETYFNEKVSENEKIRAGVAIVDSLPKTPTGKIERKVVKDKILSTLKCK